MNITVYLGANEGNDPSLRKAVRELGTWIGESGNRLVYGGSKSGLMGEIAESVLQAGGEVTGVEPQFFIDMEYQYDAITELIVTKDMTERKTKMIELGDVFIAFPGGTGTLEEIAEVMSKVSLKHLTQCRSPVSRGTTARSQAIFVEILANSPYYVSYLSYTGLIVSATHRQAAAVRSAAANRLSSSFRRHKYHHMEQRPAGHRPRTVRSTADNRLRDKRR